MTFKVETGLFKDGAASFASSAIHRPVNHSSVCQQPGSPGWPQQFLRVMIFLKLFLRTSQIFFHKGMAT